MRRLGTKILRGIALFLMAFGIFGTALSIAMHRWEPIVHTIACFVFACIAYEFSRISDEFADISDRYKRM